MTGAHLNIEVKEMPKTHGLALSMTLAFQVRIRRSVGGRWMGYCWPLIRRQ